MIFYHNITQNYEIRVTRWRVILTVFVKSGDMTMKVLVIDRLHSKLYYISKSRNSPYLEN
ncbi:hypothetical protein V1477_014768 [Vespula maculifrons]|uniref:Uncharacterized protein n=1 Tax=Vespula maculifrons TaxID=7453 RepID=A0ABD2BID7_VESMC